MRVQIGVSYNPWPEVTQFTYKTEDSRLRLLKWKIVDCLILLLFTGPLFLGFWRGIWALTDICFEAVSYSMSLWITGLGGGILLTFYTIVYDFYGTKISWERYPKSLRWLAYQGNILFSAIVDIVYWRGCWYAANEFFQNSLTAKLMVILISHMILWKLRWQRCVLTCPLVLAHDFDCTDTYKDKWTQHQVDFSEQNQYNSDSNITTEKTWWVRVWLNFLDSGFFELINVMVWWGLWTLQDYLVIPQDTKKSWLISLSAGHLICVTLLSCQFWAASLCAKISTPEAKHIFENVWFFIANVGVVTYWRGVWGLWDLYFLGNVLDPWLAPWPFLSNLFSAIIGYGLMAITGQTATYMAKDDLEDGDVKDGTGILLKISYLTSLIDRREQIFNKTRVSSI